jgi:hypothetical protein
MHLSWTKDRALLATCLQKPSGNLLPGAARNQNATPGVPAQLGGAQVMIGKLALRHLRSVTHESPNGEKPKRGFSDQQR